MRFPISAVLPTLVGYPGWKDPESESGNARCYLMRFPISAVLPTLVGYLLPIVH